MVFVVSRVPYGNSSAGYINLTRSRIRVGISYASTLTASFRSITGFTVYGPKPTSSVNCAASNGPIASARSTPQPATNV